MRADRLKPLPALALAIGVLFYTGSHSLTLAWASTAMIVLGVAFFALVPGFRRLFNRRGMLRIAAVAIPAGLINGWFMLPAIAYQGQTWIGNNVQMATSYLLTSMYYVEPRAHPEASRATGPIRAAAPRTPAPLARHRLAGGRPGARPTALAVAVAAHGRAHARSRAWECGS